MTEKRRLGPACGLREGRDERLASNSIVVRHELETRRLDPPTHCEGLERGLALKWAVVENTRSASNIGRGKSRDGACEKLATAIHGPR